MASTKGWSFEEILEDGPNFHRVERVNANSTHLLQTIEKFEEKGTPLVIEGFHEHPKWPQHIFTLDYFSQHCGSSDINVRNVYDLKDSTISLTEFISKCRLAGPHRTENERERLYGRESECPQTWDKWLQSGDIVPQELVSKGPNDMFQYRPLNPQAAVETPSCYLAIGDTLSPFHKNLCASTGQNLMCYAEGDGSSFWFLTASSSASLAAEYLQSLGQELDHENYFVTLEELKKAPFKIYVLEQKLGDMVLVPPRSSHQVINSGGLTIRTSWSRMTLKGLATAYYHELPVYRRVCRPEVYRIKSTICHAVIALSAKLNNSSNDLEDEPLFQNLKELSLLYEAVLTEEGQGEDIGITVKLVSRSTAVYEDNRIVCDFCSGDIFESFFECRRCCDSSDEPCRVCPGCYAEGRTCKCSTPEMTPMQYRNFDILLDIRSKSLQLIHNYEFRNGILSDFENELASVRNSTPAIFHGACRLYKIRIDSTKKTQKVCTRLSNVQDENHSVRFSWALTCRKCHYSRCFSHILMAYRMHSVEALLIHASGETSNTYHDKHMGARAMFEKNTETLTKTKKHGVPLYGTMQGYHLLVDIATRYQHCKPAKPNFTQFGWYDNPLPDASAAQLEHVSTVSTHRKVPKTLTTITSESSNSKKRKFVAFVDVPRAPYYTKLSRAKSTLNVHFSQHNQVSRSVIQDNLSTETSINTLQERTDDSERRRTPTNNLPIIHDDNDQQIWEDGYEQTEETAPSPVTFRTEGLSSARSSYNGDKTSDGLILNPQSNQRDPSDSPWSVLTPKWVNEEASSPSLWSNSRASSRSSWSNSRAPSHSSWSDSRAPSHSSWSGPTPKWVEEGAPSRSPWSNPRALSDSPWSVPTPKWVDAGSPIELAESNIPLIKME